MTTLKDYAVPTKANTEFKDWWQLFNRALVARGEPEAGWRMARDCYDVGESPETAATYLENCD